MVNEFLSFFFGKDSCFHISLDVDIKEGRYTSDTHGSSVLSLDCCKVSEVQPLECFFCIFCWLGNVESVDSSHFFHTLEGTDLFCEFFPLTDDIVTHGSVSAVCEIVLLHSDQVDRFRRGQHGGNRRRYVLFRKYPEDR